MWCRCTARHTCTDSAAPSAAVCHQNLHPDLACGLGLAEKVYCHSFASSMAQPAHQQSFMRSFGKSSTVPSVREMHENVQPQSCASPIFLGCLQQGPMKMSMENQQLHLWHATDTCTTPDPRSNTSSLPSQGIPKQRHCLHKSTDLSFRLATMHERTAQAHAPSITQR